MAIGAPGPTERRDAILVAFVVREVDVVFVWEFRLVVADVIRWRIDDPGVGVACVTPPPV